MCHTLVNLFIVSILSASIAALSSLTAMAQSQGYSSDFNGDGYDDLAVSIPGKEINGVAYAGAIRIIPGSKGGLVTSNSYLLYRGSGAPGEPHPQEEFGRALAVGNFNGDDFADLASGTWLTRGEQNGRKICGSVTVFYGSEEGLQHKTDEIPNFTDDNCAQYGSALISGDFNNDGLDELVIGMPYAGIDQSGGILVMKGTDDGLTHFSIDDGFNGSYIHSRANTRFGGVLTIGYFNDDAFMDLAVGAPGLGPRRFADGGGDVYILFGSINWLPNNLQGAVTLDQGAQGVHGQVEDRDGFGAALTAGDFDGRAGDDLAVGVPYEDFEGTPRGDIVAAGVVHVFTTASRISSHDNRLWHQDVDKIGGQIEPSDYFGSALATGDFNGDGRMELVVGVTGENFGEIEDAGVFHVIDNPTRDPTVVREAFWHSDAFGLGYGLRAGDGGGSLDANGDFRGGKFGVGDFNGDGYADLAYGIPTRDIASVENAGAVIVIYGSARGLSSVGNQFWAEHTPGLNGALGQYAGFGSALSSAVRMNKRRNCGLLCRVFRGNEAYERMGRH